MNDETIKTIETFALHMVDGTTFWVEGESIDDVFRKIDGLRLQGKRWLKVINMNNWLQELEDESSYVNIDYIVSIKS